MQQQHFLVLVVAVVVVVDPVAPVDLAASVPSAASADPPYDLAVHELPPGAIVPMCWG